MTRIFSILSWVGILLLLAAVVLRLEIVKPEWAQYANYPFWAGIVLVVLYTASQWREIRRVLPQPQRSLRRDCQRQRAHRARHSGRGQLPVDATEQALGPDCQQQYTLSEQTVKLLKGLDSPGKVPGVRFAPDQFDRFRARLNEYAYQSSKVGIEYLDADQKAIEAKQYNDDT
jgi:hypothetical protein